jgi:plasmid replication initiation protein
MDNGKGVLGLKFSDEVSGMLVNDRDFLSYAIRHTVAFSSASAMRIYEMILYQLQRCPAKQLTKKIEIKRLKEILGLQDNYTRFSSFNSRVLGPAKNQINKHSDISISYTIVKEGRTPVSVKFVAKYKKTKQDKENTKNLLGTHETQEELEIIDSTNNTGIYSHSQTEKSNLDLTKDQLDFIRYSADNSGLPADLLLGECIKRNKSGLKLSDIILDSIKAVKEDFGLL